MLHSAARRRPNGVGAVGHLDLPFPASHIRDSAHVSEQPSVLTARRGYGDWAIGLLDTIYMLPSGYYPGDLVDTATGGITAGYRMRSLVAKDMRAMTDAARADGIRVGLVSAFQANAHRYGFVMSYPKGRSSVTCYGCEPWHYRYVGRALAGQIVESGLSPREFLWKLDH